jgi:hypothetical protein
MNGPLPGLCASCRHARAVVSASGAAFVQCLRARSDPRFPKWPALPVLACPGYETGEGEAVV